MGLLSRILKSPELAMALLGGGMGGLTDNDENPWDRAAMGAAVGGAGTTLGRKAIKGMLGRVPIRQYSPQERQQLFMEARRALGQSPQQSTQFPSSTQLSKLGEFGDMQAAEKYGDQIGQSGMDRVHSALDDIGDVGKRLWDNVDYMGERLAPKDRWREAKQFVDKEWPWAVGPAIAGGAGYGAYEMLKDRFPNEENEATVRLLRRAGVDPSETGIRLFQAENGISQSGKLDDATLEALALKMKENRGPDNAPHLPMAP